MDMNKKVKCSICKTECEYREMYEYRGALSCEKCFDELQTKRDAERQQIIEAEKHKTDRFKGINLSNDSIGKANKRILQADIEIAKKESKQVNDYERGNF